MSGEIKPRILIVDDEKLVLMGLKYILEEENYLVDICYNGEEALRVIENNFYEVVIADIVMKGIDGIALLKRIKEKYPLTEVIIITAYGSMKNALEAIREGAFDYIQKPFNADELKIRMQRALEKITNFRELQKAKDTLAKTNEELKELLRIASHDLNNPLLAARGYLEILEEEIKPYITPNMKRYLESIYNNLQSIKAILEGVLDLSRIKDKEASFKTLNFADVVKEVVNSFKYRLEEERINLCLKKDFPKVYGDPVMLRTLLSNLVDNAIKFQKANASKREIKIGWTDQGKYYHFFVEDNGIGIPKEEQEIIFKPMVRGKGVERYGTGLGLSFVQTIANKHGGQAWVKSTVGKGSTFYFSLPKKIGI